MLPILTAQVANWINVAVVNVGPTETAPRAIAQDAASEPCDALPQPRNEWNSPKGSGRVGVNGSNL